MHKELTGSIVALLVAIATLATSTALADFKTDLELKNFDPTTASTSIQLPVSYNFNQYTTDLSWGYTAMALLESRYRVLQPGGKLFLSRRWIQYQGMRTRFTDLITKKKDDIREFGWPMDAMRIASEDGLYLFHDAPDVVSGVNYGPLRDDVQHASNPTAMMNQVLDAVFGGFPAQTGTVDNQGPMPPKVLAFHVFGPDQWMSVSPSDLNGGVTGWGPHLAPGLRSTTPNSYFIPMTPAFGLISQSLSANAPIGYCTAGHCAMIDGVYFDTKGNVIAYKIQDSVYYADVAGMAYYADPASLRAHLFELTVLKSIARPKN